MEYHVATGNELWSILIDEVQYSIEDNTIYLAAGTYYHSLPDYGIVGGFVTCPNGHSLTLMGEPGTSARDVIIDAHGHGVCLGILDSAYGGGICWDTLTSPAFDRPEILIAGITLQNGNYEYACSGLEIGSYFYAVTVRDCIIKDNASDCGRGGGLSITEPFNLLVEGNQILGNTIRPRWVHWHSGEEGWDCRGGGLCVGNARNGYVIRNNIIADNVAEGESSKGGGMYLPLDGLACSSPVPLTGHVINNTVCRNSAAQGGGIHFTEVPLGSVNLYNNIVRSNTATNDDGSEDLYFATPPDLPEDRLPSFALFNNNYSQALGTTVSSGGNTDVDPRFVDPDSQDFHLASDSPMIDAGLLTVPDPPGLPEHDYEGQARVNNGAVDIGADEYHLTVPAGKAARANARIGCNGGSGAVLVKPRAGVKLTISLDANDDKGKPSRVSVVMTSEKARYFLSRSGWVEEEAVYYQGALKDILPIDLPTPPAMKAEGTYHFGLGVEMKEKPGQASVSGGGPKVHLSDHVTCHVLGRRG